MLLENSARGAVGVDSVLGEVLGSTIAITTDTRAYVGLLPLFLVLFGGWYVTRYRSELLFWMGACTTAVLLTLGPWTPLSRLVFYLPLYGSFQSPGRHLLIFAFGMHLSPLVSSSLTFPVARIAGFWPAVRCSSAQY